MRIAISGPANTGKTTFIKSFLYSWPQYKIPDKTYRSIIENTDRKHSSQTTPETQSAILNFMVEQLKENKKDDKILYDRCSLDNLAYTLWAYEKNIEGFTDEFIANTIHNVRESLRNLDIIFLTSFDDSYDIEDNGVRDTDKNFIVEIDNIFSSLYAQYIQHPTADVFFPANDSPCIIQLPSHPQLRINLVSEYLDQDGNLYGEEQSILAPGNLKQMEQLLSTQQKINEEEKKKTRTRKTLL